MPFLIPHIANERLELHLRDLRRYVRNRDEIAEHTTADAQDAAASSDGSAAPDTADRS